MSVMGTFTASLRAIGDVQALPATVSLEEGQLSITAGETEIGTWPLTEINLEPMPTGYRLAAEGEQILIELKDVESFSEALKEVSKRKFRIPTLRRGKGEDPETTSWEDNAPSPAPAAATPVEPRPERQVALPPAPEDAKPQRVKKPKNPEATGWTEKGLAFVDGTLHTAQKRFGPYLPEWVFTRIMFGVAFVALILMVVLPGLVSAFMLISGALIVVFGAVIYSDPMLASRWLPGRTQPPHVLLFGVAILMMGVLLGVIAN
jgi:hypothetical protein